MSLGKHQFPVFILHWIGWMKKLIKIVALVTPLYTGTFPPISDHNFGSNVVVPFTAVSVGNSRSHDYYRPRGYGRLWLQHVVATPSVPVRVEGICVVMATLVMKS